MFRQNTLHNNYLDKYLTIAYWYDGLYTQPVIYYLQCNVRGEIQIWTDAIEVGHDNITLHVDYSGSQTEHQCTNETTLDILPKWDINCTIEYNAPIPRPGYSVLFYSNATIEGNQYEFTSIY